MRERMYVVMRPAPALVLMAALLVASGCLVGALPVPSPTDVTPAAPQANAGAREMAVLRQLQLIAQGEGLYALNNGKYATLDQLVAAGHLNRLPDGLNYNISLSLSSDSQSYTVTATPQSYGPDGQRSFFVDQTGVIRGANHSGSPATAADPPAKDMLGN